MLTVYTARMGYRGPDVLDITRGSADRAAKRGQPSPGEPFAPSHAILDPALAARDEAERLRAAGEYRRAGDLMGRAWERYAAAFNVEMRRSYLRDHDAWDALLTRESVTLVCFCDHPRQCHRFLLADILERLGARYVGERGAVVDNVRQLALGGAR
jgi:hypothetical protein